MGNLPSNWVRKRSVGAADASTVQPYIEGYAQAIYCLNTTTDPKTGTGLASP